jgi:CHAT domain-containing protein
VRAIASLFQHATKLVDRDFTPTNLQRALTNADYSIVHLATHGRFSSDPRQTFIVTALGGTSTADPVAGKLPLDRFQSMLKQTRSGAIDTIVLSACETATGDRRAALGLAGTAISSGASSTLASLWAVDDRATTELMQQFYSSIVRSNGATKAAALQAAQISVRKQYAHPYYWAGFVLVGNWL